MMLQAFDAAKTRGRRSSITEVGDPFQRDAWVAAGHAVIGRMADLRQVFPITTSGVFVDTRLSHTVSVKRIGLAIAEGLHLSEWLVEAIAQCHDPAHCPYSHLGETILSQHLTEIGYGLYNHSEAAYHLLEEVAGLNLSHEVLRGVKWHSYFSGVMQTTEVPHEYRAVALADLIAYTIGDARDASRLLGSGAYRGNMLVSPAEAPALLDALNQHQQALGRTENERVRGLVSSVVSESLATGEVCFETNPEVPAFQGLLDFLVREIYTRTDLPEHVDRLHRVLSALVDSDIAINPYEVFSRLTDLELGHLDKLGQINADALKKLPVCDLPLLERGDFAFLEPDLSWAKP